jgi:hypothetical protein
LAFWQVPWGVAIASTMVGGVGFGIGRLGEYLDPEEPREYESVF